MQNRAKVLAKVIERGIGKPYIDQLYDSIRTGVYGLPGTGAIQLKDLVKELAELLDKVEPSSSESD